MFTTYYLANIVDNFSNIFRTIPRHPWCRPIPLTSRTTPGITSARGSPTRIPRVEGHLPRHSNRNNSFLNYLPNRHLRKAVKGLHSLHPPEDLNFYHHHHHLNHLHDLNVACRLHHNGNSSYNNPHRHNNNNFLEQNFINLKRQHIKRLPHPHHRGCPCPTRSTPNVAPSRMYN